MLTVSCAFITLKQNVKSNNATILLIIFFVTIANFDFLKIITA